MQASKTDCLLTITLLFSRSHSHPYEVFLAGFLQWLHCMMNPSCWNVPFHLAAISHPRLLKFCLSFLLIVVNSSDFYVFSFILHILRPPDFMYLLERQSDRESKREREHLQLLVHSPNDDRSLVRLILPQWQGPQALEPASSAFTGALVQNWVRSSTAKTCSWHHDMGRWQCQQKLKVLHQNASPRKF